MRDRFSEGSLWLHQEYLITRRHPSRWKLSSRNTHSQWLPNENPRWPWSKKDRRVNQSVMHRSKLYTSDWPSKELSHEFSSAINSLFLTTDLTPHQMLGGLFWTNVSLVGFCFTSRIAVHLQLRRKLKRHCKPKTLTMDIKSYFGAFSQVDITNTCSYPDRDPRSSFGTSDNNETTDPISITLPLLHSSNPKVLAFNEAVRVRLRKSVFYADRPMVYPLHLPRKWQQFFYT